MAKPFTLPQALEELKQRTQGKIEFINPGTERVQGFFVILVNSVEWAELPKGLDSS